MKEIPHTFKLYHLANVNLYWLALADIVYLL